MTMKLLANLRLFLALGACVLMSGPARAQAVSTFTVQATGSVTSVTDSINFSGPVYVSATIVPDPAGGPATAVVSVDARSLVATSAVTGATFVNSGQARLTRVFGASDVIKTTFSFFPPGPGGFLRGRTALVTLNLTYDLTTQALTGATAAISNF